MVCINSSIYIYKYNIYIYIYYIYIYIAEILTRPKWKKNWTVTNKLNEDN